MDTRHSFQSAPGSARRRLAPSFRERFSPRNNTRVNNTLYTDHYTVVIQVRLVTILIIHGLGTYLSQTDFLLVI